MRVVKLLSITIALAALISGCLPVQKAEEAQPVAAPEKPKAAKIETEEEKAAKIGTLKVSIPKTTFSPGEPIKLTFTFKTGKFELNLKKADLSPEGLLARTVIKTESGEVVQPKSPIKVPSEGEVIGIGAEAMKVERGITLKPGEEVKVEVENLLDYYDLKPGRYTLQTILSLEVFEKTYIKKSPRLLEIENEIRAIRLNPKIPAQDKEAAIRNLRQEIEFLRSRGKELETLYVILDSVMGRTPKIKSNVVSFTVE
ncbi:hypothetical protein DRP77_09250 [Candidatus Poribacteria bacterium]|nr:MAG: hypothetical protein DRP77_09250 [Candidatus Poribacteria bacterium]